jgi:hypothetical protein
MPHSPRFEFGPFHLDLNDRLLTRAGEVISLRPKATEILVRLVTNAGQLIKRDELLKEVWPDTFVEESNLSQTIFTLFVGRLHSRHIGISIDVELVEPGTGWQWWGETFDSAKQDRLELQNEITRQLRQP